MRCPHLPLIPGPSARPFLLVLAVTAVGCTSRQNPPGSSSGSTSAASSPSTGGTSTISGSGTTGEATGGSSTGTTGSSSTGSPYRSPFVDGGYVFCTLPNASDAGPHGDGGPASWLCQPGTYFCDPSGDIGNCSECRNDGDCANPALPTYDPKRPRCDLSSGVAGYQGFCQQCLGDSDCAGNPSGQHCELDAGAIAPSIVQQGLETCGPVPTPFLAPCYSNSYLHDGGCTPSFMCHYDQDCAGLISESQELVPYCIAGSCTPCQNAYCPGRLCFADQCQPLGADGGLTCNMGHFECGCTSTSACSGVWPECEELDAGFTNGAGDPAGLCGCDRDDQCGDGGLKCIQPLGPGDTHLLGYCGVVCGDPRLPPCAVFTGQHTAVCDGYAHVCRACTSNAECQDLTAGQTGPYCRGDGSCGCKVSADCPTGETCQGPYLVAPDQSRLGSCALPPPACTPASCNGRLCDPGGGCEAQAVCATGYDCTIAGRYRPICEGDAGLCRQCLDDLDCLKGDFGPQLTTCNAVGVCSANCLTDLDCVGNALGSVCLTGNGYICGCANDQECTGNPGGPRCNTTPQDPFYGLCSCAASSECAAGTSCQVVTDTDSLCSSHCGSDADCPSGFSCDATHTCRPRCDQGRICAAPDPVCDVSDLVGRNGEPVTPKEYPTWCYECLSAAECGAGLGCLADAGFACGPCDQRSDCLPGAACLDGVCHSGCDGGGCPAGEVCDALGVGGHGAGICLGCLGPTDCPDDQGCDSATRTCGTCRGPTAKGGPFDCPPGAICSNYWSETSTSGVCLQNCDALTCPLGQICDLFRPLTPDHKYCFSCLRDSDCADAGAGAWCDTSVNLTFTCQPAPR